MWDTRFALWICIVVIAASIPVKHDDCTYELDMEEKVFRINCNKNVTLKVTGNEKTMFLTQGDSQRKPLWFERLSGSGFYPSKKNKTTRDIIGPNTKTVRKLKDATKLLKRAKKRLAYRIKKIDNITDTLAEGNVDLEEDLERLHKYNPGTILANRAMIAALRNQYRYLQMAMLTQNNEMKEIISAITSLVSATQKSVRSTLAMYTDYQKEMVMINMALMQSNISKAEKRKGSTRYKSFACIDTVVAS